MLLRRWKPLIATSPVTGLLMPSRPADLSTAPFVLLARQRSGSTWVMDLLNSHPRVIGFPELFHSDEFGRPVVGGNCELYLWNSYRAAHDWPTGRLKRTRLYFQYLDQEVFRSRPDFDAVGLKLMYNQAVSSIALPLYLKLRGVRIIHLIRRNYLDAILSAEAVRARGIAHAVAGADVGRLKIPLEAHSLKYRLDQRAGEIEAARSYCQTLGVPTCEVFYEDIVQDVANLVPTLELLGVDPDVSHLTSELKKLNATSHRDLIENWDEIRDVLNGTPYSSMLRA